MPVQSTRRRALKSLTVKRSESPAPADALVSAPPRLNLAGFCCYCGDRGCRSPECVTRYNASWWAVCPACNGQGGDEFGTVCGCVRGVTEAFASTPDAVRAHEALPDSQATAVALPTRPTAVARPIDLDTVSQDEWWVALYAADVPVADWKAAPTDRLTSIALTAITRLGRETVTETAATVRAAITGRQWAQWETLMPSRDRRSAAEHYATRIFDALQAHKTPALRAVAGWREAVAA